MLTELIPSRSNVHSDGISGRRNMTIEERLRKDLTAAMKARDKPKLSAIRSVQTEVSAAKSAPGFTGAVDDQLYTKTIATYVKQITRSKNEYDALGDSGREQSEKLAYEIDYLTHYLPTTLDEAATAALVDKIMSDIGADADTPMGRIIGAVMSSGESVDGSLVNKIVRQKLDA